uniref:Ozone-responsive stress related protein n=1 Tax=Leersia perrieri TaxID=77586 RepID=A0A0D9WL37_9ORYZ
MQVSHLPAREQQRSNHLLLSRNERVSSPLLPSPPAAAAAADSDPNHAKMTAGYIAGSLVGSFAIAYLCDTFVSDKKAFGGSIPKTVSDKEWWQATDTKFQAWPRTAGPPVIMNPISRQNFIVKSTE